MLLNLQSNALKFTEKGFVRIEVEIVETNLDHFLKVSIIDSGIGIKEQDKHKLFKLFGFVKDTTNLNANGIGLGLMISDMIVSKYDGKITFDSTEGQGSTFTFTIKIQLDLIRTNASNCLNSDPDITIIQRDEKNEDGQRSDSSAEDLNKNLNPESSDSD